MKNEATTTAMVALRTATLETTGETEANSKTSKGPKRSRSSSSMTARSPRSAGSGAGSSISAKLVVSPALM